MCMTVDADLIIGQSAALQGITVAPERADRLAAEVDAINSAVRAAAGRLTFDDGPGAFLRTLAALKDG
jgi:hypothetical protein